MAVEYQWLRHNRVTARVRHGLAPKASGEAGPPAESRPRGGRGRVPPRWAAVVRARRSRPRHLRTVAADVVDLDGDHQVLLAGSAERVLVGAKRAVPPQMTAQREREQCREVDTSKGLATIFPAP